MAWSGCGMVWDYMHMQFARLMLCSTISFTLSTMCVLCVYSTHKAIKCLGCGHEVLPNQVMKYFELHNIIYNYYNYILAATSPTSGCYVGKAQNILAEFGLENNQQPLS